MRLALAVLAAAAPALFAQNISVGFRGGIPFTDAFDQVQSSGVSSLFKNKPSWWIFGATLEVRLPAGFGVTFDALYNRLGYETASSANLTQRFSGGQWEFPAMLRYRIGPQPLIKPFMAAGGSFNKITGIRTPSSSVTGAVFGGGVEIKVPFMRIAPEVRVTRRLSENVTLGSVRSNLTQAVFLVGLTF
ncbi:MAG: porin family protein [Acidobacteria bacterium]|nr:porin family protein [Acidobacteriota bacterium]